MAQPHLLSDKRTSTAPDPPSRSNDRCRSILAFGNLSMPQPWPPTALLSRVDARTRNGRLCLAWRAQQFSLQMKICRQIRNQPETFDIRQRGATGFAKFASPMSGASPVTMIGKANNHERLQTCPCREFSVLYLWRTACRCTNRSTPDSKDRSPRSRSVDESGPSPACASHHQGCTWSMRHNRPALWPNYKSKPAVMPRRDYLGGSCGCQFNSGYKNGPTLNSSQGKSPTISQCISSLFSTTPLTLQ
jgi:hypothetical protein